LKSNENYIRKKYLELIANVLYVRVKIYKNLFCSCSFIYMCIHCLGHGSFLHPAPLPDPSLLPFSVSGRSCSALVTDFVDEKT
jgi:hypothetical protein